MGADIRRRYALADDNRRQPDLHLRAASEARVSDPADPQKVFRWLLERSYDDKGNIVVYDYVSEDDVGVSRSSPPERNRLAYAQKYLKRARYGNSLAYLVHQVAFDESVWEAANIWHFECVLDYGDHDPVDPDPEASLPWPARKDPFSSYRSGFEIRTYRLCRRVLMFHRFAELGPDAQLVGSTRLIYDGDPEQPGNFVATRLVEVVHVNHEPGQPDAPSPGVRFTYSDAVVAEEVGAISAAEIAQLPAGSRRQWIDFEGEGLSGLLSQDDAGWFYQRNLGDGRFGAPELLAELPSIAAVATASIQQLIDLDGDGRLELVSLEAGLTGSYALDHDARWQPFVGLRDRPVIDWEDPQLRTIDLTGDGVPDLLITRDDCLCWCPSSGRAGYSAMQRVSKELDEERGPALVFADGSQSIFLADMSGDGLTDIVRIRSGEICYWPNLGYGRFGAKVNMDGAPTFGTPSEFDPARVRLGDIDGTGTTDLIYLDSGAIHYWYNQAGNSWSETHTISSFPRVDSLATVQVVDLLGTGTACVVWMSTLAADAAHPIRYLPLMSAGKPHLLTEIDNGLGALTRIRYAPSTKFYLDDCRAGRPWLTKLPFPVHVVERVETYDAIADNRFVTRYTYHHGFYDGFEREFRGFGMVEQWDTEHYSELGIDGLFPPGNELDEASHVPPVLTRTWFHTGTYHGPDPIARQFAHEYYAGDPSAWVLPDTELPADTDVEEQWEACRALKGRMLRQEVYALDGSPEQEHPYTVSEARYELRVEQHKGAQRYAVISVHDAETLTYHYERNPADPRISHNLILETDQYGHVRRSAAVAYPRRLPDLPQQTTMHVVVSEVDVIHLDSMLSDYRLALPDEQRSYELRGATSSGLWTQAGLAGALSSASEVDFSAPAPALGVVDKRLLGRARLRYYRNNLDPNDPLPFGQAESLAVVHEQVRLVFTQSSLDQAELGGRITPVLLGEGGYRNDVDGDPTHWWSVSGIRLYDQLDPGAMFYLPTAVRDPFGAESLIAYDGHGLFISQITDALGKVVGATHDYRVLAPYLVTDANGNRSQSVYDTRGRVIASAVMGKVGETDPLAMGDSVDAYVRVPTSMDGEGNPLGQLSDVLANPHAYLQQASSFYYYDAFAWRRDGVPPAAVSVVRETHAAVEGETPSPVYLSVAYSSGFGRVILAKSQAEDGLAPVYDIGGALVLDGEGQPQLAASSDRWVGTGATVFNNKGLPVRQYEPFFDAGPAYTREDALVRIGISPEPSYDPLGRVIRTRFPDGTFSHVEFDAWQHTSYDPNDTSLDSEWYIANSDPGASAAQQEAASKAAAHYATPTRTYLDTLGRPVLSIAHNKRRYVQPDNSFVFEDEYIPTRTTLDVEGNTIAIHDGRGCEHLTLAQARSHLGNQVARYLYTMGGTLLYQQSMDSGQRWSLNNIAGASIHGWDLRDDLGDGRGHHFHTRYDVLQRPVDTRVDIPQISGATQTVTIQRLVYGEELPLAQALAGNLLGRVCLQFDGAGLVKTHAFDFKGNPLEVSRRLADDYQTRPDWSGLEGLSPASMETSALLEAGAYTSTSSYNALNRKRESSGPDGSVFRPTYNRAKLLEAVEVNLRGAGTPTLFVESIDYDAHGRRKFVRYANGVETTYDYDPLTFRLLRVHTTRGSDDLQDLHYCYDASGNVSEVRDDAITPIYFGNEVVEGRSRYTYDAIYRLIEATGRESAAATEPATHLEFPMGTQIPAHDFALRNYTQRYDYDPVGNILQMRHSAASGSWTRDYGYEAGNNRVTQTGAPGDPSPDLYGHDGNGNLLALPHLSAMGWDPHDQLVHVDVGPGDEVFYNYDAGRQRVRKVRIKDGIRTERIYLGEFEIYRRYVAYSNTVRDELETVHVSDDAVRICMVETTTIEDSTPLLSPITRFRFQLSNHLSSTTVELDEVGAIISYEEYHPYGTTAYHASNGVLQVSPKRYRYTGMERDEESGLNYHSARYYATWLGRWISTDPSGLSGGPHLYEYSFDSPVMFSDGSGYQPRLPPPYSTTHHPENFLGDSPNAGGNWRAAQEAVLSRAYPNAASFEEAVAAYEADVNSRPRGSNRQRGSGIWRARQIFNRVRRAFWRLEGSNPSYRYSEAERARMRRGRAPSPDVQIHHGGEVGLADAPGNARTTLGAQSMQMRSGNAGDVNSSHGLDHRVRDLQQAGDANPGRTAMSERAAQTGGQSSFVDSSSRPTRTPRGGAVPDVPSARTIGRVGQASRGARGALSALGPLGDLYDAYRFVTTDDWVERAEIVGEYAIAVISAPVGAFVAASSRNSTEQSTCESIGGGACQALIVYLEQHPNASLEDADAFLGRYAADLQAAGEDRDAIRQVQERYLQPGPQAPRPQLRLEDPQTRVQGGSI